MRLQKLFSSHMNNESARIFNSAITAPAIAAAFELKILEELKQEGRLCTKQFCQDQNLHQETVAEILRALSYFGITTPISTIDKNIFGPGPNFADVYREKGYFLWLVRGYAHMFQNLSTFARNDERGVSPNFCRNGNFIAKAADDYGATFVDSYFEKMLAEFPFKTAADLGCGSAARLIKLAEKDRQFRGVGVDFDSDSVGLARDTIKAHGLQARLKVLRQDASTLEQCSEFEDIEIIFSFFMGHDLWPHDKCLQAFRYLSVAFPAAKRFLLCDTYRSQMDGVSHIPVFTLGFEFTHAIMGQYIPSISEWLDLFPEAGWKCVNYVNIDIPSSAIFDLRPA
jgi:hypothetical protein